MRHLHSRLNPGISFAQGSARSGALRVLGLGLGFGLGLACLSAILAQEAAPRASTSSSTTPRRDLKGNPIEAVGASSCATFACHGGNGGEGDHRSAYTIWMALDPHSRAEAVLKEPRSMAIEERLAVFSGRKLLKAETDARCLGCHVSPKIDNRNPQPIVAGPEGVGCESCHGPASKWLAPHSLASWKDLSPSRKNELGMTPTTEIAARVNLCVGCHIGKAGQDVDHDLLAAGHPRLDFEFFSFFEALPKHWDDSQVRRDQPDHDARAWALGQAVAAREALGLLSLRAHAAVERQAKKPVASSPLGIWPEFAEYACSSCHHPLTETTLPSTRDAKTGLVNLPWNHWYDATASSLQPLAKAGPTGEEDGPLASLRRLMESIDPQPKDAERLALEAKDQVGAWVSTAPARWNLREVQQLLSRLVADDPGSPPLSWEGATQKFIGISALNGTLERLGQTPSTRMKAALDEMRREVEKSSREERPGQWTAEGFTKALQRYRGELSSKTTDN